MSHSAEAVQSGWFGTSSNESAVERERESNIFYFLLFVI